MYIYTICSIQKYDGERLIYVGSTIDYEKRFILHKRHCFNENCHGYNSKVYQLIRQYGWDAFVCEVIEVLDDNTTDKELLFREQFYIDKYDSKRSMNTNDAITGLDMVDYHKLYDAERYKNNREKYLARSNEWNKKNREKCLARSKENYEKNREMVIALNREWQKNNRVRYNELQRNSYHKRNAWKNAVTDLRGIDPSFFC